MSLNHRQLLIKALLFAFLVVFVSQHTSLANAYTESLKNQLKKAKNDTVKVDLLNQLTFNQIVISPEKSQQYNLEALTLARAIEYEVGEAYAYDVRGILYRKGGFYEEAVKDHLKSLEINKQLDKQMAIALNLSNLAMVYLDQNIYEESIDYLKEAYAMKIDMGDSAGMIFTLNDLTTAYIGLQDFDSALYYSRQSLVMASKLKKHEFEAQALFNIARVHAYNHDFEKADLELKNVIIRSIESENLYVLAKSYKLLSDINRTQKNYQEAIEYGLKSLEVARQSDLAIDIHDALQSLARSYSMINDYENAYRFQRLYVSYVDSVYDSKSEQRSMLLASKYEFETQQKLMQAEYDNQIAQQRLIMLIAGGLILAMIIIFLLVIRKNKLLSNAFSRIEMANRDIALQKEEIEQQKEKIHAQADKLIHVNASKDQIFNIISHDLRGPIESLNGLLDLVTSNDITQSDFKTFSEHLREKVQGLSYTLNNLLIWSRSQMKGLTVAPKEVELYPIVQNKIRLFSEMARNKEITLEMEVEEAIKGFADEDQIRMVLRNLLNNAVKFTKRGGLIRIIVEERTDEILISVKDNGVGISKENQKKLFSSSSHFTSYGTSGEKGTGIGLLLCKEIIQKNGGRFNLESEEGQGSTFSFTVPKLFKDESSLAELSQEKED